MTTTTNKAQSAKKENAKNVRANVQSKQNKKETATQKAARLAAQEQEREKKAAQKAAEKEQRAAARAAKLEAQKAETKEKHENAKSAINYNTYGVIIDAREATPFAACKHFYLDILSACGGSLNVILQKIIGENKRDFAEIYADRVRKLAKEKGAQRFTAFLVWRVLWQDLKQYTKGQAKYDAAAADAIEKLQSAIEKRKATKKAADAARAAKKAEK